MRTGASGTYLKIVEPKLERLESKILKPELEPEGPNLLVLLVSPSISVSNSASEVELWFVDLLYDSDVLANSWKPGSIIFFNYKPEK